MVARFVRIAAVAATLVRIPGIYLAESRIPAGGAFMNSYTSDPYFDPKSQYSQGHSLGDVGGQPLIGEPLGRMPPCRLLAGHCTARVRRGRSPYY